jgi:hypothetical protein
MPAVATYDIAPLDAQETALELGQEVASPVLTMVHSPGSLFTNSIQVNLPVNNRISEWYAAAQQALALAALGVRRTADTDKDPKHQGQDGLAHDSHSSVNSRSRSWSNNARRDGAAGDTYTNLVLHWFNSYTLNWVPVRRGSLVDGKLMSDVPPDVLNNPAFSGKVANLLVTTSEAADLPICGEFQDLVAGKVCVCVFAYASKYTSKNPYTVCTYTH